ncbi:MAG TPA: FAD-dependent oxidoreductase, partial [Fimbriimonadaceae bacterium]|nr:FAD-dependent oxidoreductase [Fimbriimonadaceae bacterium]
ARWTSDVQWLDQDDMDEVADRPIEQYLRDEGFSNAAIDRFFRPFLGGIFLDRSLSGSCRQLLFVWRYLNEGHTAVPNLGMEEIPKQIGITIGQDVRLNTRVTGLNRNGAVRGLKLDDGTALEAEAIVLACDAENAAALSGIPMQTEFRHSITLYFLAPEKPTRHGGLVLNGNMKGIANHLAVMPNSPSGRFVLSATILGERPETNEQLAEIVKAELRLWFPNRDPEAWAFLRGYRCRNSQLVQAPGFQSARPGYDTGTPGLYFAGEFTTNSSIDGATQSGIECAEHLLRGLGVLAS